MLDGHVTTAHALLLLDEPGCRHELVRGELRRTSCAGWWNGAIAARIGGRLFEYATTHRLGLAFASGTGFLLARDPDTVRSPDASFVRRERMPKETDSGYWLGAPDLAVEITSSSDTWEHVLEKVNDWLVHGARIVWVVEGETRRVSVFDAAGTVTVVGPDDALHGGDVLPGFTLAVRDLFPPIGSA